MYAQRLAFLNASFRGEAPTVRGHTRSTTLKSSWCCRGRPKAAIGYWSSKGHSIAIVGLRTVGHQTSHTARGLYKLISGTGLESHSKIHQLHYIFHYSEHGNLVFFATTATIYCHHPPPPVNMRFAIIFASFVAGLAVALPDPTPQGYAGPCANDNCGVNGLQCGNRICVPWPSTDPALRKGCTCSFA